MEFRLNHWAGVLRERKESGLSIRRWCRENGVQEKTYYYWQRKLRELSSRELLSAHQDAQSKSIVPSGWAVCSTEPVASPNAISIEIGKSLVKVSSDADAELLGKVCRVLISLC